MSEVVVVRRGGVGWQWLIGGIVEALSRLAGAMIQSRRQRGGSGEHRVGSVESILRRPSGGPRCNPPLCHALAGRWLASLEGRWYVCRDNSADQIREVIG